MLPSAGVEPGERHLLGPQTTGRIYHHLSPPEYAIMPTYDLTIPMQDGIHLRNEWHAAESWPLPQTRWQDLWLLADGTLAALPGHEGCREYLSLPAALGRGPHTNRPLLPDILAWETPVFKKPVELVGPFVLHLQAASTAIDTDWIVKLCDTAPDGRSQDLTQGWLRASHRALDETRSRPYRPYHPHDQAEPLIPGVCTSFEIALLPTAHRFSTGHWLRLLLTSQDSPRFAMGAISHIPLGIPARNTVFSSSRITMPLVGGVLEAAE